jgi:hypothetical protein
VDHDVKPGVEKDIGEGHAWPGIRERIMAADVRGRQRGRRARDHGRPVREPRRREFHDTGERGGYRNGEAMRTTDYNDLDETPEAVASVPATMAANGAHLAALLTERRYSPA